MEFLILAVVIIGALIAIASGIWVAFALGSAISTEGKKKIPSDTKNN
jgi:energy-converting hydrogenase Eha subunit A